MKVTTEELGSCEILIKVEFDEDEKAQALKEAAQAISKEMTIPGFRRGKAPYDVVRRLVGEKTIYDVALENLSHKIYPKLISDLNLDPIGPGQVQDASAEPFSITFRVPLKPIVELGDYRSLKVKKKKVEVSEEEVNEVLKKLQEERATWVTVERSASKGDLVVADMTFKYGSQERRNENAVLFLDPEQEPIPGLVQNLEGLEAGQEKSFSLNLKDGQEITLHLKVHEVKGKQLPPLDDEFARSWGDFNSLEELKEQIRKDLREQKERTATDEAFYEALDALLSNAKVEFPPLLLEREVENTLLEQDKALRKRGLSLEQYLKAEGKSFEQYRQEIRPQVEERLKNRLALAKFIYEEKIEVPESEVEEFIKAYDSWLAERKIRRRFPTPGLKEELATALLRAKIKDRILEIMVEEAQDESEGNNPDGD